MVLRSARQAWAVVFEGLRAQGWGEASGGRVGSNDWRIVDGMTCGQVMVIIDALDEQFYTWGMWAYTEPTEHEQAEQRQRELFLLGVLVSALDAAGLPDVRDDAECDAEQLLLTMLLADTRQRERNGRELYCKADIARAIGVERRCLGSRYKWGRRYDAAQRALEDLISGALGPVAEVVDSLRARDAQPEPGAGGVLPGFTLKVCGPSLAFV